MNAAIAFVVAFFAGSIPTSYIWVRVKRGQDIRKMGSGNPGATNVIRCVGLMDGIAVLLCDAAKGALPVYFMMRMPAAPTANPEVFGLLLGVAAILGHAFTPFLGFRGGKGVSTGAGVALAVYPALFVVALSVWLAVLFATRLMVLASLAGAYTFALLCVITHQLPAVEIISIAAAIFMTWTHRSNLRRIIRGEEKQLRINRQN